jgi:hypothetical protein
LIGGVSAPLLFGYLIETGSRTALSYGYALAAFLMISAACCEWWFGVETAGRSLEHIAPPLCTTKPKSRVAKLRKLVPYALRANAQR